MTGYEVGTPCAHHCSSIRFRQARQTYAYNNAFSNQVELQAEEGFASPSRAKSGVSGPPTPLSEYNDGPYLSDIRYFKNMHLVLEAGHTGRGGSLDTESKTKENTSQRPLPDRAPTVSDYPPFRTLIQNVAPIPNLNNLIVAGETEVWLYPVGVYAIGRGEAEAVIFNGKLDTSTALCLMAQHVAARFGIKCIDKSDPLSRYWRDGPFNR